MSLPRQRKNGVKDRRTGRGWTQAELAEQAAVSRAAVSAIEINRLVPSVAAALSLARALECSVEDLFGSADQRIETAAWAWPPTREPCRYWEAIVGTRTLRFACEPTSSGTLEHDGVYSRGSFSTRERHSSRLTLVLASCDPAVSILAAQLARADGIRLIALSRSSREALALLDKKLVHAAGVHFAEGRSSDGNIDMVKSQLGAGYRLLRSARWQEGLSVDPAVKARSVRSLLAMDLRWVGREPGSAARACLDQLRPGRPPRRLARDHRGVAEAVRCGWADVGVCLRLAGEEAGLNFLPVREESYDICFAAESEADPRLRGLVRAMRSTSYRRLAGELPGVDTSDMGESLAIV